MDYSDYEGADIVTDLNHPIKKELYNNFDALIGWPIEYIFNFPNYKKLYENGKSWRKYFYFY